MSQLGTNRYDGVAVEGILFCGGVGLASKRTGRGTNAALALSAACLPALPAIRLSDVLDYVCQD